MSTTSRPSGGESHERHRQEHHLPRLPPRERPRGRAQPRHHPAAGRPVQRCQRGRGPQHQGLHGHPAPVRAPAVRGRPGPALPHADRHGLQPQRGGGGGHRHRGRLDQEGGGRHRRHGQAGGGLWHRGPRRPRHHHARQQGGARVRAVGQREAARGLPAARAVGLHQVRRERHHQRLRGQPHRGQRLRQTARPGQLPVLWRDHRTHWRRAHRGRALRYRRRAREVHVHVQSLPGGGGPSQDLGSL